MALLDLKANTDRLIVGLLVLAAILAAAVFFLNKDDDSRGKDDSRAAASGLASCKGKDRVMIPAQKLTAGMVDIQTVKRDGAVQLDPPKDPDLVGWWDQSAKAGYAVGQTLITGHTVHNGSGALNNIGKLKKGQLVKVCDDGELAVFRTTKVVELTKEQVAQRAQQLFGQQRRDGRLVLVTCTDWIGPGNYRSNLIVFGTPVRTA